MAPRRSLPFRATAARRRALIKSHRPDVICRELRGNVPTRLRKLRDGEYDAIVLAENIAKERERLWRSLKRWLHFIRNTG